MTARHHDTGYKELFSHPEFVQQLIEGFAPSEIAELMDFSTLRQHNGHYITPMFEEKIEDVVWSVEVTWQGTTERVFLYILLEFQSAVDHTMPIRLANYVISFYSSLLKQKVVTPGQGLPPVFPVLLYNGAKPWTAPRDINAMITPQLPTPLRAYQLHMQYYLIDEGRYTDEELSLRQTPLSGIFSVENAGESLEGLQRGVDRIVAMIKADPDKERIDRITTRWLKRHFHWLGAKVNLDQINSLVEDKEMLAENLENLLKKERLEARLEGRHEEAQKILRKQISLKFGDLPPWAQQRLEQATPDQLEDWSAAILVADSLESLLGEH